MSYNEFKLLFILEINVTQLIFCKVVKPLSNTKKIVNRMYVRNLCLFKLHYYLCSKFQERIIPNKSPLSWFYSHFSGLTRKAKNTIKVKKKKVHLLFLYGLENLDNTALIAVNIYAFKHLTIFPPSYFSYNLIIILIPEKVTHYTNKYIIKIKNVKDNGIKDTSA